MLLASTDAHNRKCFYDEKKLAWKEGEEDLHLHVLIIWRRAKIIFKWKFSANVQGSEIKF